MPLQKNQERVARRRYSVEFKTEALGLKRAGHRKYQVETPIGQERRGVDYIKKGRRVLREKPEVKYAFMAVNTGKFSITAQCEAFGVSRSGYCSWRHRQANPSSRHLYREDLDRLVFEAFHARKGRSGAVGLTLDRDSGSFLQPQDGGCQHEEAGSCGQGSQEVQGHHRFESRSARGSQSIGLGFRR